MGGARNAGSAGDHPCRIAESGVACLVSILGLKKERRRTRCHYNLSRLVTRVVVQNVHRRRHRPYGYELAEIPPHRRAMRTSPAPARQRHRILDADSPTVCSWKKNKMGCYSHAPRGSPVALVRVSTGRSAFSLICMISRLYIRLSPRCRFQQAAPLFDSPLGSVASTL